MAFCPFLPIFPILEAQISIIPWFFPRLDTNFNSLMHLNAICRWVRLLSQQIFNNQPYHNSKVHKSIVYIHKVCIMHINAKIHHPTMNVKYPISPFYQIVVSTMPTFLSSLPSHKNP